MKSGKVGAIKLQSQEQKKQKIEQNGPKNYLGVGGGEEAPPG